MEWHVFSLDAQALGWPAAAAAVAVPGCVMQKNATAYGKHTLVADDFTWQLPSRARYGTVHRVMASFERAALSSGNHIQILLRFKSSLPVPGREQQRI